MRRLLTTATVAVALTIPAVATLGFGGVAGAKTVGADCGLERGLHQI